MTQDSYDNYIEAIAYYKAQLADELINKIQKDSCETRKTQMDLNIVQTFFEIFCCWELPEENANDSIENDNCLTIDQMKNMSVLLNRIFGTKYCVDFYIRYGQ